MKILQFINSLSARGAENLVVDTSIAYFKRGIEVDILILKDTESPYTLELEKYPGIKVFALTKTKSVYNPLLLLKLNTFFKQYDLVHVHLFPALYWAAISRMLNGHVSRMILTEHNTTNKRRNKRLFRYFDRKIYAQYDHIVPISIAASRNLKMHLGKSFTNIHHINNGVAIEKFQKALPYKKESFGLNNEDYIIIQVSSFRYPKDQKTLIKAMTELDDNTHLFLVGEGPLKQENIDYAKSLNVIGRVHFLGVRKDVPRLLKSADIIVLSSHYEGLSLSSVEGLASGTPFVSTRVPGLEEVVEGAGILFEYQDFKSLIKIVERLKSDKDYCEEISRKCQKRAQKYNFEDMIEQYIEVYKNTIKQP